MEAGKGTGSSPPSITTQLFGSREPPPSSNEVLRALLSPQSKVIILKGMRVKFEVQKMEEWVPSIRSK
ncbi:hypothetical protein F383_16750 [Gossypium arboreum]|uniref:Uncharacterized protein n=1 Tax=Gossypium arboreum TaxID=29729 RepID=A0A0B0NGX0_GOSAR|nr:hypothetical protein F383_16750 [Gossypium arboreum]